MTVKIVGIRERSKFEMFFAIRYSIQRYVVTVEFEDKTRKDFYVWGGSSSYSEESTRSLFWSLRNELQEYMRKQKGVGSIDPHEVIGKEVEI